MERVAPFLRAAQVGGTEENAVSDANEIVMQRVRKEVPCCEQRGRRGYYNDSCTITERYREDIYVVLPCICMYLPFVSVCLQQCTTFLIYY